VNLTDADKTRLWALFGHAVDVHDEALGRLVAALRASDLIVHQSLSALTAAGLVTVSGEGQVRYQPATPALDTLVDAAERLYARSPDAVRRLIVASATGDLAAFADAFRFRRD